MYYLLIILLVIIIIYIFFMNPNIENYDDPANEGAIVQKNFPVDPLEGLQLPWYQVAWDYPSWFYPYFYNYYTVDPYLDKPYRYDNKSNAL